MTATKTKTTGKKKTTKATKSTKAKAAKPATATDAKKLSQIAAAVAVLTKAGEPMNCKAMVEAMTTQGLWASPGGATPDATLYSSILREINTKGKDARFKKVDRGQFALVNRK
jgi:vancomycin resistance protein YoaR